MVAALLAATSSLQRPSREALEPRTVRHDQITAANALSSFGMQVGVLLGPAIGGVLIAWVGIGWCFVVDVVALAVACALYAAMRPYPHRGETTPPSLRGIAEGWRYAVGRRDLLGTYVVDIAAMLLAMPVVLFPALAAEVFDRPELLGLLYSAETSAPSSRRRSAAGPPTSTTTAGRSSSPPRRTARASPSRASRRRSAWRWCASRWPGRPT